jgi:HNH endonuclease
MATSDPYDIVADDRETLFELLDSLHVPRETFDRPENRYVTALLRTCDVRTTMNFISEQIQNGEPSDVVITNMNTAAKGIVQRWTQRPGAKAPLVTWKRSSPDEWAKSKARNGDICEITGVQRLTDVAHIFPHCNLREAVLPDDNVGRFNTTVNANPVYQERREFWERLRMWRTAEEILAWKRAVFGPDFDEKRLQAADTVKNLLVVQPTYHRAWPKGFFALKPLPDEFPMIEDGERVWVKRVEFYWLPNADIQKGEHLPLEIMKKGSKHPIFGHQVTFDGRTLLSGCCIDLKSRIREHLPSHAILEMQYLLQVLTALAGGAESEELDIESDDDDDIADENQA